MGAAARAIAFIPATGQAFTAPYAGRTITTWVDVLDQIDAWVDPDPNRVYAILDKLSTHRAVDVLLWSLTHPRWEVVFQPIYAAYLTLIEPWWTILRSLARKGRRCATWDDIWAALERSTADGNAHRHPFIWGRRRSRAPRRPGIGTLPAVL